MKTTTLWNPAQANANLGRKVTVGASDEAATTLENGANEDTNNKINNVDKVDIANASARNYGHGASSTDTHHTYSIDRIYAQKKVSETGRRCH